MKRTKQKASGSSTLKPAGQSLRSKLETTVSPINLKTRYQLSNLLVDLRLLGTLKLQKLVVGLARKANMPTLADYDFKRASRDHLNAIMDLLIVKIELDRDICADKRVMRNETHSCSLAMIQANARYNANKSDMKKLLKRIEAICGTSSTSLIQKQAARGSEERMSHVSTTEHSRVKSSMILTRFKHRRSR